MSDDYGRIHQLAFKATISTFFAIAVLSAICRIAVRIHYQKRILIDDYVLLFGGITLITAFVLTNVSFEDIYVFERSFLRPTELGPQRLQSVGFDDRSIGKMRIAYTAEFMAWATIFAVKMSYLMFFRQILDRAQTQLTYWKVVTSAVLVAGIYCFSCVFICCPHFGHSSVQCVQGGGYTKTVAATQVANALDMLTDLLVVSVPIKLLRKINVRLQQKLVLYAFLCLSVCMFAITLTRAIGTTFNGIYGPTVDAQWYMFWQMLEACVAVIVVSLTSFRSLYGIKSLQREQKNKKVYEPWLSTYRRNFMNRKKQRKVDEFGYPVSSDSYTLPSVPDRTLNGLCTIISGCRKSTHGPIRGSRLLSTDELQKNDEESDVIRVVVDLDARESIRSYV